MSSPIEASGASERPPFWRNVEVLKVLAQIAAVLGAAALMWWLVGNLLTNLDEQGIPTGFGFIDDPAGFQVRDSGFDSSSPIWKLLLVGIQNTAVSALVGISIALVLGIVIGIGRLSQNWIVNKLSTLYVETFRNIPPLVIIIFVGSALFVNNTALPAFNPRQPPNLVKLPGTDENLMILSKSRLGFPSFYNAENTWWIFWLLVLVALIAAAIVWRWRTKVNVETGEPHHRVLFGLGTLVGLSAIVYIVLGGPIRISWPTVSESGRLIEGGIATNDAYVALTLALGLYTASHIAEIIRGSILAVPKGQNEAANALALSAFQRYRFVVLPQAFRIAIPPIINQFLNLTKNTSLAVAVAYPDVTAVVRTAIGNGQPATQMILVLMLIYLSFSLVISLVLNIVNRRFQVVGR